MDMGGIASSADLPRNMQQAKNVKRNFSTGSDEFIVLFNTLTEKFVHCVQMAPEPACILCTDTQLNQFFH